MSIELLKRYITEVMMDQNIVRKDPEGSGKLVVRKLVTFIKPSSRFTAGEDVDAELTPGGDVIMGDVEKWRPDYEKTGRRPRSVSGKKHRVA